MSIRQIVKRNGIPVDYDRDRIATAIFKAAASIGGTDRGESERLASIVEQRLESMYGSESPTVEDVQDVVETVLISEGRVNTSRAYISYRTQRAQRRESRADLAASTFNNIPYKKIYDVLCWNLDHGCESVAALNRIIEKKMFGELVAACEKRYLSECRAAASNVLDHIDDIRVIIVAGPSSSGKTTTTIKMMEQLEAEGYVQKAINIDHYFFNLEDHPRDEFGDYDYETPQALDLDLINQHLGQLLAGETIRTPHYDFQTGQRTLEVHEMSLASKEILLIDSLHGLYPDMTAAVPDKNKFRLYIETLGQLRGESGEFMRWADHRLMRRMIRDSWHRNHKPEETITHWHYVRKSELQHIIPYNVSADYLVNSAMPYEIPILKNKLFHYFPDAMAQFKDHPKRQDAYIRAKRVFDLLSPLKTWNEDNIVPCTSHLREFIGGSRYEY
ncbi:uridine kinase family protein [Tichowtungia aerotolerans]|uniref:Response regulator SirA n=1 Tax=Tichowtungia aerotolerans TaxID=2697043 RepID=A0A6P1MA79_9BACT|nr:ATP cone domain-containing protein [Tichowtungia aerotolerans]QHI69993.1 response regulator SirA [Tichowtungia aerotolerans]